MIRLYGHARGHDSFAQVTRGMKRALEAHGALAGFVTVDSDQAAEPGGFAAPLSLNCGVPAGLHKAHREGRHVQHWLLLAPNGNALPADFVQWLREPARAEGLLAPSRWACGVLTRLFPGLPVVLAPHGVTPSIHRPVEEEAAARRVSWEAGNWLVLHLTSTETERKGTKELLLAWAALQREGKLGQGTELRIVAHPRFAGEIHWLADSLGLDEGLAALRVTVEWGLKWSQQELAQLYRSAHLVVQPSRAEGFGLCCLEGLCCGTPILATNGHGHSQWNVPGLPGAIAITNGPDAPMGDFEGSTAPTVSVEELRLALLDAHESWFVCAEAALDNASRLGQEWAWERQNADAIKALAIQAEEAGWG